MSLYRRFETANLPSFVTTNTYERRPIFSSTSACELLIQTLYDVRSETHCLLLAFAIMPDHLHLVTVPGQHKLGKIVQLVKGRFARLFNHERAGSGAVWQSRCHERALLSEEALARAIEYVHHNPVAARLAHEPGEYHWSSASGYQTDLGVYLGGPVRQAEA